jgi:hypothetical protein
VLKQDAQLGLEKKTFILKMSNRCGGYICSALIKNKLHRLLGYNRRRSSEAIIADKKDGFSATIQNRVSVTILANSVMR